MLGRLFGSASPFYGSDNYPRDSVVDEEYTRTLLYPGQVSAGRVGEFDDWNGLELGGSKDFRIILAQDALGDSEEPCVLFDTHPSPQSPKIPDSASRGGSSQALTQGRGSSIASNLKSPTSPLRPKAHQRTFSNGPAISRPIRNRSSTFSGASDEHDPRSLRGSDSRDDTRNILSCAFGSPASASSGTKMHVLSSGSGAYQPPITSSSVGRGGSPSLAYFRRRELLVRTSAPESPGSRLEHHQRSYSASGNGQSASDALLITKIFSVNLPEAKDLEDSPASPTAQRVGVTSSPSTAAALSPTTKAKKPRAKKTPAFAVILVVQLPSNINSSPRPWSQGGMQTPPIHNSGRTFPRSVNTHVDSSRSVTSITPLDHGDPRVNALVEHWDVVDRALTRLQIVSTPKILRHLKQADSFTAALVTKPSRPKEKTMQRTNQINIYLVPLTLSSDSTLKDAALRATQRIRRALKIPRVIVGQGRWGLWNDELSRIARSCGSKEQNTFLVSLLTSFLGAHVSEWVRPFASLRAHRRRSIRHRRDGLDTIGARTIILSNDRSIARRLIFLLSSFLTGDDPFASMVDPARGRGSSISLRHTILDLASMEAPTQPPRSRSPEGQPNPRSDHLQGGLLISRGVPQNDSDVCSIRSIPIPNSDLSVRKTSTPTTSTMTPDILTPVPQFSSGSQLDLQSFPEGSGASVKLNKIWWNANRDGESSTASTKWGSLLSGFWSKDSSAGASDSTVPSASSSIRARRAAPPDASALSMGQENDVKSEPAQENECAQFVGSPASNHVPTKLQVNVDEGVIDVDIGIPGFLGSSDDSVLPSPPLSNIQRVPSAASFDSLRPSKAQTSLQASRPKSRIAGFLPSFHPDYSLQAVKLNKADLAGLKREVRRAMLSEPYLAESATSDWVDVSTTVIANVQTASIQRLRLRRKISRFQDDIGNAGRFAVPHVEDLDEIGLVQRFRTECGEFVQEQSFCEETLTDTEPLLAGAIDSILAPNSNSGSRNMSPAPSKVSVKTANGPKATHQDSRTPPALGGSRSPSVSLPPCVFGDSIVKALEEVVKVITCNLPHELKRHNPDNGAVERPDPQFKRTQENSLREGIRIWLLNADLAARG